MDCEVVIAPRTALRGEKMLRAMVAAADEAGVRVTVTDRRRQQAPWLMTYGLGHPERRAANVAHVRAGGRLIGWDLGYWNREVPDAFGMRLTIDADHPHGWITPAPGWRFDREGIELREDFDPTGPIVLVGMGKKQRRMLGISARAWELGAIRKLRREFPNRRIVYRPKREESPLDGCPTARGPIEHVLHGASLVVCAHSNVAVDACIAGVPVRCSDGAALTLYRDNPQPSREQRLEFLRSLAWWQWSPPEAAEAWAFIKGCLQ
ncbi:hypothetical protein ACQQ2N_12140 [Dokdonella sp. MW10]|uniref:hypothetical protein n=1 Tax=Dokdonella sp. MW10 TaxID=2992926 RepID=UPI003F7E75F7